MRNNNRIRIPDAAFHVHPTRRQVIAVEVGFSQSLENLFTSAQQFLDHGGAKAFTSVKIYESHQHQGIQQEWPLLHLG